MIITLGRIETQDVWDGEPFRADLGRRPNLIVERKAVAMVWLLSGTPEDLDRAKVKAAELGYRVFKFDEREENPLEATKRQLLKEK
jgi:hypothetical protein